MLKENKNGVFTYKNESYDFSFKTSLSAIEKIAFVRNVVDTIVNSNGYNVVIKDLIIDFNIVGLFTNVDTSFIEMKDEDGNDINHIILIEHFLEESDIVSIVKANMEDGVLDELIKAIDLNIQYLTGICPNSVNDALANLLSTINKKIDNDIDMNSMMDVMQKFANITEKFTVEDVVNAYMNSDVHKNNLAEIEEAKTKTKTKTKTNKAKSE